MAGNEGASLEDDLGTTTTDDESLDTLLKQLDLERRVMAADGQHETSASCGSEEILEESGEPAPAPPLAEPEVFTEDVGEEGIHLVVIPKGEEQKEEEEEDLLDDPGGGEGGDEETVVVEDRHKRENGAAAAARDGPRAVVDHIMDVNGNGAPKTWRWQKTLGLDEVRVQDRTTEGDMEHEDLDMLEFAKKYYNVHVANTGYTGAISKTVNMVRRRSLSEIVPMQELLRYSKSSTITTSHIQLHITENVTLACSIFKDLCKYMKGELKGDAANIAIRSLVAYGIERVELRDEIYIQLIRQINCNPNADACLRAMAVWAMCAVTFSPSKTLYKYVIWYLRRCCEDKDTKVGTYATWCLRHLRASRANPRRMPPSVPEIEAIRSLQPIMCRIHLLDGKVKVVPVEPYETAGEVLKNVKERIGLNNLHGWALYESIADHDRFIREYEYIADVISDWEKKQRIQTAVGSPRRASPRVRKAPNSMNLGRIVFCKRVFSASCKIPDDPVEHQLLYSQTLHNNVETDEYSIPESACLHLAGLQAQVTHGNYEENKPKRYSDVEDYLCQRVLVSDSRDWSQEIAAAHKKYGGGMNELAAKMSYVDLVSQFPLYGCVKFFAHYKGLWHFGIEFIIAINHVDIKLISIQEKTIAYEYRYADIEMMKVDFEDSFLTIQLRHHVKGKQKCYMFECLDLEDLASLIQEYAPHVVTWETVYKNIPPRKKWLVCEEDWLQVYEDVVTCRQMLVKSSVMQRPHDQTRSIIRSALKKISGRSCGPERAEDIDAHSNHWSFSKLPFKQSLLAFDSHDLEDIAIRMFNSALVYTGIESAAVLDEMDMVGVVQTLTTKCMEKDDLCNEFYLQLIKQTTDAPITDSSNKAAIRYWDLISVACCVVLPPNSLILNYLHLHLKRYALHKYLEEGQFAQFCIKSLHKTYEKKGRKYPPSNKEIVCITKRSSIDICMSLPDGHQIQVEFDSMTTMTEIIEQTKGRIGMRLEAEGYGIFQSCGELEEYSSPDEKLGDSLYKWEVWAHNNNTTTQDLRYMFKKRIFVEPFLSINDPVEVDMLYNQSVTELFEGKIHLTKADAIQLCALRAQTDYGDYGYANNFDYNSVMRILPRHLREHIKVSDISAVHKTLVGTAITEANVAFLDVLKHWPLYGATFYDVTQTYSEKLPKSLWLAVSQIGIHFMECRGQKVYATYPHKEILECSPSMKSLVLTIGSQSTGPRYLLFTSEATQIVQLILDYQLVVLGRHSTATTCSDSLDLENQPSTSAELHTYPSSDGHTKL